MFLHNQNKVKKQFRAEKKKQNTFAFHETRLHKRVGVDLVTLISTI